MPTDVKVPAMGESITEVEIGDWLKAEGDPIKKDEEIVALESEKATVQLPSPAAGTLGKILKRKGEKAAIGEVVALIESAQKPAEKAEPAQRPAERAEAPQKLAEKAEPAKKQASAEALRSITPAPPKPKSTPVAGQRTEPPPAKAIEAPVAGAQKPGPVSIAPTAPMAPSRPERPVPAAVPSANGQALERQEEIVPMTLLRRTVAQRLVEAQHTMAMLTTFNEIDMSAVIALRKDNQENFVQKHGIKLGFMSFFAKAAIEALKAIPQVNASVRGNDIVYHNYFDIGIAIGGGRPGDGVA